MDRTDALTEKLVAVVANRTPDQPEFIQAFEDIAHDVVTVEKASRAFTSARVLERLADPDRIIQFRVEWLDDNGDVQINRAWRVQQSNFLGPYKGGLRFHPSVNLSVLRFLAFEQVFKGALTGLPLGGAKGGSDFDPKGRSKREIMAFCQAFMLKLAPYIGPSVDVPAGDIGVSLREIGWMQGQYLRQCGRWNGALTGKDPAFGGSALRTQATGYGLIYFVSHMLAEAGDHLEGQCVAISGAGNVATHAAEKAIDLGAHVMCLSDTSGVLICEDGLTRADITWVREQKSNGGDLSDPPSSSGARHEPEASPWELACDIALPCATQNEVNGAAAQELIDGPCRLVAEGANMPLTAEASRKIAESPMHYAPGKASNAGGVAVSGLEMSQNAQGRYMPAGEVDDALRTIMGDIHRRIRTEAETNERNLRRAANVAAYRQLAEAMVALGVA